MDKSQQNLRPPIVTIMGHVDHGKTTLLDAIRKTNTASREHGGITQHIGAYQISFAGKPITFVDTPGHAAFEKMRSRGAEIADIVVLTVAATEGVKPQTVEAIRHIKKVNKPLIVAFTKVDLPNINLEKAKKELQKEDVVVESFGGNVPVVEVAAPKGKGINELLEIVELIWQISPQESQINLPMEAVVVESYLDKFRGPIVSVIVKKGILKVGQKLQLDGETIAIKALTDDLGKNVEEAQPGKPVEVLGFKKVLDVGSTVQDINITKATSFIAHASMEEIIARSQEAKDKFKIVLKADVLGSLEAITANIPKKIDIVSSSVGDVLPSDVTTAKVANSPILAFNVNLPSSVKSQAEREKVLIREYKVIYELITDLEDIAQSFEEAKQELKIKGSAKIIASFIVEGNKVAGSRVSKGKIQVGDAVLIKSPQGQTKETKIASLRKFKKSVETVPVGDECGVTFNADIDFNVGDIIESLG